MSLTQRLDKMGRFGIGSIDLLDREALHTVFENSSVACYQGLESATKSGFKKYNDDNKDAVIYIGFNVNPHPYC